MICDMCGVVIHGKNMNKRFCTSCRKLRASLRIYNRRMEEASLPTINLKEFLTIKEEKKELPEGIYNKIRTHGWRGI